MDGTYPGGSRAGAAKPKPKAPQPAPKPKSPPARRKPGRPEPKRPGRKPAPGPRPSPKPAPKPAAPPAKPKRPVKPGRPFTPPDQGPKPKFGKPKPKPKANSLKFFRPPTPVQIIGDGLGIPDPLDMLFPPGGDRPSKFTAPPGWGVLASCQRNTAYTGGPYLWTFCALTATTCLSNQAGGTSALLTRRTVPGYADPEFNSVDPCVGIKRRIIIVEGRCVINPCNQLTGLNSRYHYREIREAPGAGQGSINGYRWFPRHVKRGPIPVSPPLKLPDPKADPWPGEGPDAQPEPAPQASPKPGDAPAGGEGVVERPKPGAYPRPVGAPIVITLPRPGGGTIAVPVPAPVTPSPSPSAPPYVVPGIGFSFRPGERPKPQVGHKRVKPPRGQRETKIKPNAVTQLLIGLINTFTESADAVNALFYAIPKPARRLGGAVGFMSPADKASFVWSNWHLVDWREFVELFMGMQITDAWVALQGKGTKFFNQQAGNTGFKDAALNGGASAGTVKGYAKSDPLTPAIRAGLDAVGELIDQTFGLKPIQADPSKPVVRNWKRINKRTERRG